MERKPDRRIKKTKNSLSSAFYELLKEKNYSEITVKELADRADITRKTFYLHYGTLDDLLREFLETRYGLVRERIGEIDFFSESFDYLDFFTKLGHLFDEYQNLLQKLMADQNSRYLLQQAMEKNESRTFEQIKNRFNMKPEILRIYFRYYTRGLTGTFLKWFANPDTIPLEEFADTIKNINLQLHQALLPHIKPQQTYR